MKRIIAAFALFHGTVGHAAVVPNGTFSNGNTGFTSAYVYGPAANELYTGAPQQGAGYYAVTSDANFNHSLFTNFGDHTTGTGLYLVANGSSAANTTVWQSTSIAVTAGKRYEFGAWFANAYPASPAQINFTVAGAIELPLVGSFAIPAGTGVWTSASYGFTAAGSFVTLSFVDTNIELHGNDFAIDDITLNAVPEPATWLMMIGGFGLVGVGLRRRAVATA